MAAQQDHPALITRLDFLLGCVIGGLLLHVFSTWTFAIVFSTGRPTYRWVVALVLFLLAIAGAMVAFEAGALSASVLVFPYVYNLVYYWQRFAHCSGQRLCLTVPKSDYLPHALLVTIALGTLGYGLGLYVSRRRAKA